jgi:hypothetical protein
MALLLLNTSTLKQSLFSKRHVDPGEQRELGQVITLAVDYVKPWLYSF